MSINPALFSSDRMDWETPRDFFNSLNEKFRFNLDVCANHFNRKCVNYFTEKDDGLDQMWMTPLLVEEKTRFWMNPPYGREIKFWVKKAYEESQEDYVSFGVGLLPARTDTSWFHDYIYQKPNVSIKFLRGRLKFVGAKSSAPFPSMLVVWGI